MLNSVLEKLGSLRPGQPVALFGDIEAACLHRTKTTPPTDQGGAQDIGIPPVLIGVDILERTKLFGVTGQVGGVVHPVGISPDLVSDQVDDFLCQCHVIRLPEPRDALW